MIGFLNINKPAGLTSHDVVARIRRLVGRKIKVGHAGTLDPAATGVLPIAIGQATRLIEYLADARKGYYAVVALGTTTTTDDAEGEAVEQRPVPPLTRDMIEAALHPLRGEIMQIPPMYSALHHQGQRLYDLARAGQHVEREPRPVTITRLELLDTADTLLTLAVECSKGTYIRALARDLGNALGCGAHLANLERTFVGSFAVAEAVPLATLQQQGDIAPYLLPPRVAVADWQPVTLTDAQSRCIRNGQPVVLDTLPMASEKLRAHAADGRLLALLQRAEDGWRPEKVFTTDT
jgi:tRNA pseudouridine55 synthase